MRNPACSLRLGFVLAASRIATGLLTLHAPPLGSRVGGRAAAPRRPKTVLYTNVASILIQSHHEEDANAKSAIKKLSRPERKALERQRKARRSRVGRGSDARSSPRTGSPDEGAGYTLHSNAVSQLTINSTAENVVRAIKRAQNLHDGHDLLQIERFLLEQTDRTFFYGFRGSLLARLAVAALHMNQPVLADKAVRERNAAHADTIAPYESAALVRGWLRVHNVTAAWDVVNTELAVPDVGPAASEGASSWSAQDCDVLLHRALSLASIASRHFFEGEPCHAVGACRQLALLGPLAREAGLRNTSQVPWTRLIRGAAVCESRRRNGTLPLEEAGIGDAAVPTVPATALPCNLVHAVLDAMTTFPSDNDDRIYEQLSNALVRRVVFVTGAVDMRGCPAPDRGEAAFIGRSNVGKSSLVNMVTNRKSLAYTSKRPGKTQQFNFFAVNDKPELERQIKYGDVVGGSKDPDSFYLVDLPGFGFAKVPEAQRDGWMTFMHEYLSRRQTLRVVFHLIDGRIGATADDAETMERVGAALRNSAVQYVVVLTKADKNVKGSSKNAGKVSRDLLQSLRQTMNEKGVGKSPVIVTSAETKLGRDDMWRYLRLASESR